jgi:hypothetical protein
MSFDICFSFIDAWFPAARGRRDYLSVISPQISDEQAKDDDDNG